MFGAFVYCGMIVALTLAAVYGIISVAEYIERKAKENDKYSLQKSRKEWL